VDFDGNSWKSLTAVITFVSKHTAKTVIPVTKFRDEGHLS